MTSTEALARTYYDSIDHGDYAALEGILSPDFVHERPDQTFEGANRFVRFMREERPMMDTTHAIDALYRGKSEVAVRGRLLHETNGENGANGMGFVDVFSFDADRIETIRTYIH